MNVMTRNKLIEFENEIASLFNDGKIPEIIHFSGGNEDQLIEIYKDIKDNDFVFSTHRSHYHALLKGINPERLKQLIIQGDSLHVFDHSINFFSSAIVSGCPTIAIGVALSIKLKKETSIVYCFVGDGAENEGSFFESVRYADAHNLPIKFIIEDNGLSVDTPTNITIPKSGIVWPPCVSRYHYVRKYPHCQTGKICQEYM